MTRSRTEWVTGELWGVSASGLAIIHQTDDDWIDAITNAVLIQRRGGGGVRGGWRHIEKFKDDQFGESGGVFRQFVLTASKQEVCHEDNQR